MKRILALILALIMILAIGVTAHADDELVDGLAAKGYKVARRTIAKYRALLDIPKARLRREL